MKHARKVLALMILVVTPLLLSGIIVPAVQEEVKTVIANEPVKFNEPSYESINALWIYNDFDMDNYASALSWDGDGSSTTPYIIEGYSIVNNSICIYIVDVSRAFEIRNCYIASETGQSGDGIYIRNATQAPIYDTTIVNKSISLLIVETPEPYIENCTITGGIDGISLYNCTGGTIHECQIQEIAIGPGINIEYSNETSVTGSHISNCLSGGVYVRYSENAIIENNIIHGNNWISTPQAGVHLLYADNAAIVGNEIWDNVRNGIFIEFSDWVYIFDNELYYNSDHGIDVIYSSHGTILQNDVYENGWWPVIPNALCGVYIGEGGEDWVIADNAIWNNTPNGIFIEFTDEVEISNNLIYDNAEHGIRTYSYGTNEHLFIRENEIYGNGWDDAGGGASVYGFENCTIEDNLIYNNTGVGISTHGSGSIITNNEVYEIIGHGIASHGSFTNITKNEVYDNAEIGINIEMTGHNRVEENIVHDNIEAGIFVYSTYSDVLWNIVYDNGVGIHLYGSQWTSIYGNDIGWNDINALQEYGTDTNEWYNGLGDFGNHWHDHVAPEGEGINRYPITNGTDTVTFDNYPECSLNLTTANPISYEILETGNVLVWAAYALNPSAYYVWIDGEYQYSEVWDGGDIELNMDGLADGDYDVMLSVFHISGHGLAFDTNVTVEDLTAPSVIMGLALVELTVGETLSAQYSSTDPSGIEWAVNDTVNFAISSTGLLTAVTDLDVGNYYLRITATDPYGHSTTRDIIISVLGSGFLELPPTLVLVIAGMGVAAVLVVVIVGYKMKKG